MKKALNGTDYVAQERPQTIWIVQDFLPLGGAANLYAEPKVGKTFASIQLAAAVSNPSVNEWLGFGICTHGPVLCLQLDTAPLLFQEEYVKPALDAGMDISNIYFGDREIAPFPFEIRPNFGDGENSGFKWLKEQIAEIKPVLVILDTLRESYDGDENDSTTQKHVVSSLFAAAHPAALLVISHEKKSTPIEGGENPITKGNRGSTYLAGKVDAIARMTTKGQFHYVSRKAPEAKIQLVRLHNGFWAVDNSSIDSKVINLIKNNPTATVAQLARTLCEETGLSPDAARKRITRAMEKK